VIIQYNVSMSSLAFGGFEVLPYCLILSIKVFRILGGFHAIKGPMKT
jgi:hypothetical protein